MTDESEARPQAHPLPAITVLGESLPYADGSESHLLELMQNSDDTSSGSDHLSRLITDWPTQYHLSAARANLLLPLALGPGKRVLDVGCGTGALLRAIAESGAEAFGVEGSYDRCLVAAERLRDLPNAHIMCGSLDDYLTARPDAAPEQFDVIVVCGVLEYTGSASGGAGGPRRFLDQLSRLLAPGGVIALAIENQWGLKYLLAYPEDHFDTPWVGVEGYWRTTSGVRTWSQEQLGELVDGAGLQVASWYASLPDYKLPNVLFREELLDGAEGRSLVKQFVRSPMTRPGAVVADMDPVLTFQAAVDSGMGMEMANSFLAVITHAGEEHAEQSHLREGLLWLSTSERTRRWRSVRVLERGDAQQWTLRLLAGGSAEAGSLRCMRSETEGVVVGDNLEDKIRRAYVRGGVDSTALEPLLRRWAEEAVGRMHELGDGAALFDVMPNNFIVDSHGDWRMVDTEFSWTGPTSDDVYLFRSLWYTAERLADAGAVPGVTSETSRGNLADLLARRAGLQLAPDVFDRWVDFETELVASLLDWTDAEVARFREEVAEVRDAPVLTFRRPMPLSAAGVADRMQVDRIQRVLDETRAQWFNTQHELDRQRLLLELAHHQVHMLRGRIKAMESSRSWRVTAPMRRARGGGQP